MLEIKTFGGLSLELDGKRISPLGSHKAEAIAVFLAVEGGRHQRSVIAAKLWPDSNASDPDGPSCYPVTAAKILAGICTHRP